MGMGKRTNEVLVEEVAELDGADAAALAAKKAAKKARKAAAAAEVAAVEPQAEEVDADALAAKKAAKKAKKAAAAAAAEAEVAEPAAEEEDAEAAAAAKAARKAAKKAKKAAAAEGEDVAMEDAAPKAEVKKEEQKPKADKVEAAKPAAVAEDDEFKDNTYKCCDCSEDWVDTADDQQFRWDKGFSETPKRCKDCRWAKKVRMEGGDPTAKGKGKKGKSGGDENTVFVRGLPYSVTEEALTKDFSECGEIVSLRMPMNDEGSAPRGFAFITYGSKEAMDKAMAFNETDYGGRTISVTDAAIKPEGKGKDGKGKGKGKDGKDGKGKGKGKGKKGKASSESFAKNTGAMVESTGTKVAFADSDDE